MLWMALAFVALLVLGTPIAFALGVAGVIGLLAEDIPLRIMPVRIFDSIDSFALLAAPFFILAGEIMSRGGITERLIKLAALITGAIRGGTAYANVVASVLFAGISGSAVADTAALGQVFIKGMPKEGYKVEYSAAVTLASSVIGPIVPPSIIMVIYAAVAQISILDLFLAGVIPGLLLAGALCAVIWFDASRNRLPKAQVTIERGEVPRLIRDGILVFMLPVIIVGGVASGVFTATEAGGIACVYAIVIAGFVLRTLNFRELWEALKVSARATATLYLIIAAASLVSYVLALGGFQGEIGRLFQAFQDTPVLFMIVLAIMMLAIGTFLEPSASIVLFVPLLLPPALALGIDPLHFSMVMIMTLTIGLITPPVGVCLFVAMKLSDVNIFRLSAAVMPFLIAEIVVVFAMVFFPVISTGLVDLLRGG